MIFAKSAKASCTQVASNQTSCTGTQKVACSQTYPTPGKIDRYCCDTQVDCDNTKAGIQQEIKKATEQQTSPPGCTQVASNQTTCTGTQPVACSQKFPTPGKINRYCCYTQADCDNAKASIQQDITDQLAKPQSSGVTCGTNNTGIKTAIGCIPVLGSTDDFLAAVLKWAVGIGGGIAFALMLYAGFMLMTAQGNPERMKAGQELLTSAVAGLILLIFSIFILKFIGVDILGLQKFGFGQ